MPVLDASGHAPSLHIACGQIRPEMITLDANVIGTVERSQDELIKERHASHAHTDTRASCALAAERRGARRSRGRRAAAEAAMGTKKKKKHSRGTARNGLRLSTV